MYLFFLYRYIGIIIVRWKHLRNRDGTKRGLTLYCGLMKKEIIITINGIIYP